MGRLIDLFVTYRFIKLLVTPFNKQDAYKNGLIDDKGYRTEKKVETPEEKSSYTVLHKLIFNIKRLMGKVPGLGSRLGTYAAALFLLKDTFKEEIEDFSYIEKQLMEELLKNPEFLSNEITEGYSGMLEGKFTLETQILLSDLKTYAEPGDELYIPEGTEPIDVILGVNIYPATHVPTNKTIYISVDDIG